MTIESTVVEVLPRTKNVNPARSKNWFRIFRKHDVSVSIGIMHCNTAQGPPLAWKVTCESERDLQSLKSGKLSFKKSLS